ncbi:NADH-quinone oxidoreductase subunit L [Ignavibacteria bacterium CHB1]|nr:MAG: NADH-quinone oxidoreductase subunit L [Chlorobiota bacterium]MBV6398724.1 NADH-quinone oxidoreductase subunit L [Ignavibacteria bacterium]MCC6885106.1 NADH-quinone oxidoreductase subunit L [Ignavibacteriales bacterium]MCE7952104.1 NADH-quinone oxidoreductase subunit L [Chlorobi bacterium CHB7]MDL1886339.1 NADH-quinone oxidoreductase subunit L [Ignavibacteria bacterium CHB1]RIK48789.1 MAG: NADH-quinone oxidoreductase subunit L [Ignavibacteriota bacterium]
MSDLFYLVTLLPLLGFLVNGLLGKKINNEKITGIIGSLMVFIPFLIASVTFFQLLSFNPEERSIFVNYFSWITAGNLEINYAFLIDPLSMVMVLVITGIGFLIHVYSIGYMHGDPGFAKFFAYLNLFIFAMLHLVLADNFLLIFLGWEGVGLCSYLLIGFWYQHKFTGEAAKKAFVMNRIGDVGFMIAMFIIFANFGTLKISEFLPQLEGYPLNDGLLIAIGLLFFLGATGKSAQIPLYTWLPDAMAGPTPVSALIHAATMVTAGIYLVARTSLLYALTPVTTQTIFIIGIVTSLLAGTIAIKQNDIKKVLAYSTVSQLGFMFIALGVFAYHVAVFHLVTHAFFKALMFLGSGSVIHGMKDEQDIRYMGGLKRKMKITFITFLIGTLAISGIPPLSGFWSKDEILYKVMSNAGTVYYIIVLISAAITAFYMFRLVSLTFYGKARYNEEKIHPHESSVMTIPLIILAVLSAIGGFIGMPHFLGVPNVFEEWLAPVFSKSYSVFDSFQPSVEHSVSFEIILILISVIVASVVSWYAFKKFSKQETFEEESGFGKVLENKYYVDEVYDTVVVEPIKNVSDKFLWNIFDVKIIDGVINGIANYFSKLSFDWRKLQTGIVQDYTAISVAGVIAIILYLLLK